MSGTTKLAVKLSTPVLAVVWLVLITARVVIFNEGGSVGAYAVVIPFWLTSALLAARALMVLASGESSWEHRFILIGLSAFFIPPITGQGLAAQVCFVAFLISVLSLIVIYTKRLRVKGHHATKQ